MAATLVEIGAASDGESEVMETSVQERDSSMDVDRTAVDISSL